MLNKLKNIKIQPIIFHKGKFTPKKLLKIGERSFKNVKRNEIPNNASKIKDVLEKLKNKPIIKTMKRKEIIYPKIDGGLFMAVELSFVFIVVELPNSLSLAVSKD